MKITYYGHSCFSVLVNDRHLLFDPFISPNKLASHINVDSVAADYIFISHGHEDHIADAVRIAKNTNAVVISNPEIVNWVLKQGVQSSHAMNIGGHWFFEFGKVKCVNAVHSSSMPDGTFGGNPMGFLVESDEGSFYYSGDTALTYDMKLIGEFKRMNFALLPIGNNFTMGIDNAIIASQFIRCDDIIGLHYDTYEAIMIDRHEARDKFSRAGKQLLLPGIGETIEV